MIGLMDSPIMWVKNKFNRKEKTTVIKIHTTKYGDLPLERLMYLLSKI
jgi:hypothetical protein